MKLTIFNTYVAMSDQAQCDRMKQLCIDNGLKIWDDRIAFVFDYQISGYSGKTIDIFAYENEFAIWQELPNTRDDDFKVTEQQFIELLKEYKLNN